MHKGKRIFLFSASIMLLLNVILICSVQAGDFASDLKGAFKSTVSSVYKATGSVPIAGSAIQGVQRSLYNNVVVNNYNSINSASAALTGAGIDNHLNTAFQMGAVTPYNAVNRISTTVSAAGINQHINTAVQGAGSAIKYADYVKNTATGTIGGAVNSLVKNWEFTGSQAQHDHFMKNNGWQGDGKISGFSAYRVINTLAYTAGGLDKNNPAGYQNAINSLSTDIHNSFNIGPWNFNPANVVTKTLNGVDLGNPTAQPLKQDALFRVKSIKPGELIGFAGAALTIESWGAKTLVGVAAGGGINAALGNGLSLLTEHRLLSAQEDYQLAREGAGGTLLLGGTVDHLIKFAAPIVKNSGTYQAIADRIDNSGTYQAIASRITNSEISQVAAHKISTGLTSQADDIISGATRGLVKSAGNGVGGLPPSPQ